MPGLTESGRKNEGNIEEWQKGHEFCVQGRNQTKRGVLPWFEEQRQEDVQVRACFHFAMHRELERRHCQTIVKISLNRRS